MAFFFNEKSIHGQFHEVGTFVNSLQKLLLLKNEINIKGYPLYCQRSLLSCMVIPETIFISVISNQPDKNLFSSTLSWIAKDGPFWDEDGIREHSEEEIFEYENDLVTDSSIAEAAYHSIVYSQAATISLVPSNFLINPLKVLWHRDARNTLNCDVQNYWEKQPLQEYLKNYEKPITSWRMMLEFATVHFPDLIFLDGILERLKQEPFNHVIAKHVIFLLNILQQLHVGFNEDGQRTAESDQLLDSFFRKKDAVFSDESDTNKNDFRQQLTFHDPNGNDVFCSYHGKIRQGVFRLHFSWPISPDIPLYIAYIGPKITKA